MERLVMPRTLGAHPTLLAAFDGAREPDRTALVFVDVHGHRRDYRYAEVSELSRRYAQALYDVGIRRGDRVVVALPTSAKWAFVVLALLRLRAVVVACDENLSSAHIFERATHSGATTIIAHRRTRRAIDEIRPNLRGIGRYLLIGEESLTWQRIDVIAERGTTFDAGGTVAEDPAFIFYEPFGTGFRGVTHTHRSLGAQAAIAGMWMGARADDIVWCPAPSSSAKAACYALAVPWFAGAATLLHEARFDAAQRAELIKEIGVSALCQSPAAYDPFAIHFSAARGSRLRRCLSTGDALPQATLERWARVGGPRIRDGFGRAETGVVAGDWDDEAPPAGAVGRALPSVDLSVLDDRGRPAGPATAGMLAVRRTLPSLFEGYLRDEPATRAAFSGDWFLLGRRASIDTDGYVRLE